VIPFFRSTAEERTMMGKQDAPEELFYRFRLEDHVPGDHPLRALDAVVSFERARTVLADYYSHTGRPSIDPELMFRMLLIGYFFGIRSERQLCNEVHLNLAYRWFCRLGLEGAVPDRSTFSKNRYGRFREGDVYRILFEQVVEQCREAGLVPGEGFAVDGSFVHGDARRDLRVESMDELLDEADPSARPVREYLAALDAGSQVHEGGAKYLSPTDPAAAWNTKEGRGRFGYFANYMIDTANAVIVDVQATPARMAQEIVAAKTMLDRVAKAHDMKPEVLAADKGYGTGPFLAWLQERNVPPHIPVLDRQRQTDGLLPREAFTFDAARNVFICPQGKILKHRISIEATRIHIYRAKSTDCCACPIRQQCTRAPQRTLSVPWDEAARQAAMAVQNTPEFQTSRRLRRKIEMLFGHMKKHFRFTRLKLRGLSGAAEEFLMMATVQNLRRLIRMRPPDISMPCRAAIACSKNP
jgi:transposase